MIHTKHIVKALLLLSGLILIAMLPWFFRVGLNLYPSLLYLMIAFAYLLTKVKTTIRWIRIFFILLGATVVVLLSLPMILASPILFIPSIIGILILVHLIGPLHADEYISHFLASLGLGFLILISYAIFTYTSNWLVSTLIIFFGAIVPIAISLIFQRFNLENFYRILHIILPFIAAVIVLVTPKDVEESKQILELLRKMETKRIPIPYISPPQSISNPVFSKMPGLKISLLNMNQNYSLRLHRVDLDVLATTLARTAEYLCLHNIPLTSNEIPPNGKINISITEPMSLDYIYHYISTYTPWPLSYYKGEMDTSYWFLKLTVYCSQPPTFSMTKIARLIPISFENDKVEFIEPKEYLAPYLHRQLDSYFDRLYYEEVY